MTPAIMLISKARIRHTVHEYRHDPQCTDYGHESAQQLGVSENQVYKTLVADTGKGLINCIVPVSGRLSMKAIAKVAGVKKLRMADVALAEKTTGYIAGGISPLGQKKQLPVFLDESALSFETIFVSAGRRGLSLELCPQDLLKQTRGKTGRLTE
ncbi:Cys-tRNA(Pro) deacylase [Spongorhabdus nitratireducens]